MVDLSIIIVSWNAKDYLYKCLKSAIRGSSKLRAEIIVVDNASTDGSPDLVRKTFPNVKLICNDDNLGFAKANNIGIKESVGKYLCLINSDIEIRDGCLESILSFMELHPEIGMVGPRILNEDGTLQPSCFGLPNVWNTFCRALALDTLFPKSPLFGGMMMRYWNHDKVRSVEALNGCFWFIKGKALNDVGLLDEDFFIYGEDIDWCKRFHDKMWEVVFYPGAQAVHYGGASSSNDPIRFYIEMYRANLQYWKKHHSRVAQIVYLFTVWLHQILRIAGQGVIYITRPEKRNQIVHTIRRSVACIRWLFNITFFRDSLKIS